MKRKIAVLEFSGHEGLRTGPFNRISQSPLQIRKNLTVNPLLAWRATETRELIFPFLVTLHFHNMSSHSGQYSIEELLALRESPLVKAPENLPQMEQWMQSPIDRRNLQASQSQYIFL